MLRTSVLIPFPFPFERLPRRLKFRGNLHLTLHSHYTFHSTIENFSACCNPSRGVKLAASQADRLRSACLLATTKPKLLMMLCHSANFEVTRMEGGRSLSPSFRRFTDMTLIMQESSYHHGSRFPDRNSEPVNSQANTSVCSNHKKQRDNNILNTIYQGHMYNLLQYLL